MRFHLSISFRIVVYKAVVVVTAASIAFNAKFVFFPFLVCVSVCYLWPFVSESQQLHNSCACNGYFALINLIN